MFWVCHLGYGQGCGHLSSLALPVLGFPGKGIWREWKPREMQLIRCWLKCFVVMWETPGGRGHSVCPLAPAQQLQSGGPAVGSHPSLPRTRCPVPAAGGTAGDASAGSAVSPSPSQPPPVSVQDTGHRVRPQSPGCGCLGWLCRCGCPAHPRTDGRTDG